MSQTLPSRSLPGAPPEASPPDALEVVLAQREPATAHSRRPTSDAALPGVIVGAIVAIGDDRRPVVRLPQGGAFVDHAARSVVPVDERHVGAEVVLALEEGDRRRPIIMGVLTAPAEMALTRMFFPPRSAAR